MKKTVIAVAAAIAVLAPVAPAAAATGNSYYIGAIETEQAAVEDEYCR